MPEIRFLRLFRGVCMLHVESAKYYGEYKMTVSFRKDGLTNYGQKTLEQCPRSAL